MKTRVFRIAGCILLVLAATVAGAQTLSFHGIVRAAGGVPLADATVWLRQNEKVITTKSGAEGRFAFENLGNGTTEVVAYKLGHAVGGFTAYMAGDTSVNVVLEEPAASSIGVFDEAGEPIPGARVKSFSVNSRFYVPVESLVPHGFPSLRADDGGVLDLLMLPKDAVVKLAIAHVRYCDADEVFLQAGGERKNVVLLTGVPMRGRVTDEAGAAVAGARLLLVQQSASGRRKAADTVSDRDGLYSVRAPAGEYVLAVAHPEYGTPEPEYVALVNNSTGIEKSIKLPPARLLSGKIEFPNRKACPGARVFFRVENTIYADTLTGMDGKFEVKVGDNEGILTIVPPTGYMTESNAQIPVNMGNKRDVRLDTIRLKKLPVISGVVEDEDGAPAARALISSLDLPAPLWAVADDEGKFQIAMRYMPGQKQAEFRAEHALRFQRREFKVKLTDTKPEKLKLRAFEPNQEKAPNENWPNHISALADLPAPPIVCSDWFNSEPLTLEALKGQVVVLTFWAGFMDSREAINRVEELRALYAVLRDVDDVAIIIVHDSISDPDEVLNYILQYGIEFPVGRDADPLVTYDNYSINYSPQTVLIDKQGILRYYQVETRLLELIKVLRRM